MLKRYAFGGFAGVLIVAAVVHVATLWPRVEELAQVLPRHSWLLVAGYGLSALTALTACALAGLLLWKASDRPDGRALTLFLGFLAVFWGSVFRFMQVSAGGDAINVEVSYGSGWLSQSALGSFLLASAAFLRFSGVFPRPLEGRLGPPRLGRFRVGRWLRRVRVAFLSPWAVWGSAVLVYLVQRFAPAALDWLSDPGATSPEAVPTAALLGFLIAILLLAGYAVLAMAMGARNLRDGYRLAGPEERRRVLWVVAGFSGAWWLVLAAVGLIAVSAAMGEGLDVLGVAAPIALVFAPLVAVIGAAIGVLYAGAIDPALALERSTVYGALGVTGIISFTALENALSELVEQWVRLPGFVGTMVAGGVVAAVLVPFRGVLRRWVGSRAEGDEAG